MSYEFFDWYTFLIGGGDKKAPRVFDWRGWWTLMAVNYPLIGGAFFDWVGCYLIRSIVKYPCGVLIDIFDWL